MNSNWTRCILLALASAFLLPAAPSEAQPVAGGGDWKEKARRLTNQPLAAIVDRGSSQSRIRLTRLEDGQLFFELGQQGGEGSMPVDQLGDVWIRIDTPAEYNEGFSELNTGVVTERTVEMFRQTVYPMIRFLGLPRTNTAIHGSVTKFFEILIAAGDLDEAVYLLQHLDFDLLDPDFEQQSINLVLQLIGTGRSDDAFNVISNIPVERVNPANIRLVMDVADSFRKASKYEQADTIYRRLSQNPNVEDSEATLWSYYCGLNQGRYIEDNGFARTVAHVPSGTRLFPLQQLILGLYYQKREQSDLFMKAIAEGIAYASPVDGWTPELMFRSAQAYEALGETSIAETVYQETARFFPKTSWADRARSAKTLSE